MNIADIIEPIEQEREKQGITIKELTRHAGIGCATYKHWKSRMVTPQLVAVSLVMDVLGLEIIVQKKVKR